MTKKTSTPTVLDRLVVESPCPADWELMQGTDQRRYCGECRKYVYDLSSMTVRQAEAILWQSKGNLCARFARLADGTTLTKELTDSSYSVRRSSPVAAAVLTAILTVAAAAVPCSNAIASQPASLSSILGRNKAQTGDGDSTIAGVVTDEHHVGISGAQLTLIDVNSQTKRTTTSSESGEFSFRMLTAGSYHIKVVAKGFKTDELPGISLGEASSRQIHLTLQTPRVMTGVVSKSLQPMRVLYDHSDLVAIARESGSVKVGSDEDVTCLRTYAISSTLKGDATVKTVSLTGPATDEGVPATKPDERFILFLIRRDEEIRGGSGDIYSGPEAMYRLPSDAIASYQKRIEELGEILALESDSTEALVEWLVRCAEEPATRWEGAYELVQSARLQEDLKSARSAKVVKPVASLPPSKVDAEGREMVLLEPAADRQTAPDEAIAELPESRFAAMLTAEQKERLSAALFATKAFNAADEALTDLVVNWDKNRVIQFLISQLTSSRQDLAKRTEFIISRLAELIDDDDISELASEYRSIQEPDPEDEDSSPEAADNRNEPIAVRRSKAVTAFLAAVASKASPQNQ
jgi:hypothetical protein